MAGTALCPRSFDASGLLGGSASPVSCLECACSIDGGDGPTNSSELGLGYSAPATLTVEDRLKIGGNIEAILSTDKDAAKAPPRDSL